MDTAVKKLLFFAEFTR